MSSAEDIIVIDEDDDDLVLIPPVSFCLDLVDDESPEDEIWEWDATVKRKFCGYSLAESEDELYELMMCYKRSMKDILEKYENSILLQQRAFCHIKCLYMYYRDLELYCCSPDKYLSYMEDIIVMYINLELEIVRPRREPVKGSARFRKDIYRVATRIISLLTTVLLGKSDKIMHVLIKLDNRITKSDVCKEILNQMYNNVFTTFVDDKSKESYCRSYILFQKWKRLQSYDKDKWATMDSCLVKLFPKMTQDAIEQDEMLSRILLMPKHSATEDLVRQLYNSIDDVARKYFEHMQAKKAAEMEDSINYTLSLLEVDDDEIGSVDKENSTEDEELSKACDDFSKLLAELPADTKIDRPDEGGESVKEEAPEEKEDEFDEFDRQNAWASWDDMFALPPTAAATAATPEPVDLFSEPVASTSSTAANQQRRIAIFHPTTITTTTTTSPTTTTITTDPTTTTTTTKTTDPTTTTETPTTERIPHRPNVIQMPNSPPPNATPSTPSSFKIATPPSASSQSPMSPPKATPFPPHSVKIATPSTSGTTTGAVAPDTSRIASQNQALDAQCSPSAVPQVPPSKTNESFADSSSSDSGSVATSSDTSSPGAWRIERISAAKIKVVRPSTLIENPTAAPSVFSAIEESAPRRQQLQPVKSPVVDTGQDQAPNKNNGNNASMHHPVVTSPSVTKTLTVATSAAATVTTRALDLDPHDEFDDILSGPIIGGGNVFHSHHSTGHGLSLQEELDLFNCSSIEGVAAPSATKGAAASHTHNGPSVEPLGPDSSRSNSPSPPYENIEDIEELENYFRKKDLPTTSQHNFNGALVCNLRSIPVPPPHPPPPPPLPAVPLPAAPPHDSILKTKKVNRGPKNGRRVQFHETQNTFHEIPARGEEQQSTREYLHYKHPRMATPHDLRLVQKKRYREYPQPVSHRSHSGSHHHHHRTGGLYKVVLSKALVKKREEDWKLRAHPYVYFNENDCNNIRVYNGLAKRKGRTIIQRVDFHKSPQHNRINHEAQDAIHRVVEVPSNLTDTGAVRNWDHLETKPEKRKNTPDAEGNKPKRGRPRKVV